MIGFLAQILTDLTVYKRLYATPNHDLWNRGRQHQTDLIAAMRKGYAPAPVGSSAAMAERHEVVLDNAADRALAEDFVRDRIEGARSCRFDLRRLCSYGHFRLSSQVMVVRDLLTGLGEPHSAYVTTLMLQCAGANARFVDLSDWRDDTEYTLREITQSKHEHVLHTVSRNPLQFNRNLHHPSWVQKIVSLPRWLRCWAFSVLLVRALYRNGPAVHTIRTRKTYRHPAPCKDRQ